VVVPGSEGADSAHYFRRCVSSVMGRRRQRGRGAPPRVPVPLNLEPDRGPGVAVLAASA
jgi:hypothetical protein